MLGTMTDAREERPTATQPEPKVRRRRPLMLVIGLAAAVVVAAVAVGIALARDDNSSSTNAVAARQLASMQQACQRWTGSSAPALGDTSASASCAAMTDWMGQQLQGGHMTGVMMWGSATTMRDTCSQWMATGPSATASASSSQAWCDAMVTWMGQRIGNWDDWMMNGRMMGR